MTDVHDMIRDVEGSDAFGDFRKRHPDAYLVHVFCNVKQGAARVELGYYHAKNDTITSFALDPVEEQPPEEVFKERGRLKELDTENVRVGLEEARAAAESFRSERYSSHPLMQEIFILQAGPVWNCTLVLATLNMLNLKVNAVSGDVQDPDIRNIMELRKT